MIPLEILQREAHQTTEEEFLVLRPHPVLVVNPDPEEGEAGELPSSMFNTAKFGTRQNVEEWISQTHEDLDVAALRRDPLDPELTSASPSAAAEAIRGQHVVFVAKREEGNPFQHMITFGRVPNNDIVFSLPSVSKLHGYLHQDMDGAWWLYDQSSTNGTWLNQVRVPPGDRAPLPDGAWINAGPALGLRFFLPATFYAFLRGLPAPDA